MGPSVQTGLTKARPRGVPGSSGLRRGAHRPPTRGRARGPAPPSGGAPSRRPALRACRKPPGVEAQFRTGAVGRLGTPAVGSPRPLGGLAHAKPLAPPGPRGGAPPATSAPATGPPPDALPARSSGPAREPVSTRHLGECGPSPTVRQPLPRPGLRQGGTDPWNMDYNGGRWCGFSITTGEDSGEHGVPQGNIFGW